MIKTSDPARHDLIPVDCFLHRIFPPGLYASDAAHIVQDRIFKPRKDCDEISLIGAVDWEAKARNSDRNWRMQLQGWAVFQPVMNFFDSYADTAGVLDFFFDLAADWWGHYGNDPDVVTTDRMPDSYAWYDMSVGFRALIIAFFRNRIAAAGLELAPARAALLDALTHKHRVNLASPETFSLNNHGVFQAQGLMALVQTSPPDATSAAQRTRALAMMSDLVASQFDKDGIHNEHSPHYHFYVLASFEAVIKSGWYQDDVLITARVKKAHAAGKWLVDPLRRPICIGDSILTVQENVIFPQTDGPGKFLMSDFDASGYSILRSPWTTPPEQASMVFLMGAYHSKTHKHRDCLTFDWFDRGARIICDGGKYAYKSDKFRNHVLSAQAHNSVEIEGFDILKIKPYGSAIKPAAALSGGVWRLRGALDFPAIKQTRTLWLCPGEWLIVEDDLTYARDRGSVQWLHLETDFRLVTAQDRRFEAVGKAGRQLFVDCLDESAKMQLHQGNEAEMKGFVSSNDYEISPALTVGFALFGKQHKIRTVLALSPAARLAAQHFVSDRLNSAAGAARAIGAKAGERDSWVATTKGAAAQSSMDQPGLTKPANILPNVPHNEFHTLDALRLKVGPATYRTWVDGVEVNFFFDRKPLQKRKLLAMFPGASARKKSHLDFQRHGWSEDFHDHDVLAFSDPSLRADNDLGLAWFQNTAQAYGIDIMTRVLQQILEVGRYSEAQTVLFGSSGGGFAALQLGNAFPLAMVIAINPQIYLYNYSPQHYGAMIEACYPGLSEAEVRRAYLSRITVQLDPAARRAPTWVLQNIHDTQHLERHLKPFVKKLPQALVAELTEAQLGTLTPEATRAFNVVLFDDAETGHAPPARDRTVAMLLPLLHQAP